MNEINKNYSKTWKDIKHINENGINFGMKENLCLFCNMQNGRILKKLLRKQ